LLRPNHIIACMKKVLGFLYARSMAIMMAGFGITAVSLLVMYTNIHQPPIARRIAFSCAIAGCVIYFIGRIFLIIHKRRQKQGRTQSLENNQE